LKQRATKAGIPSPDKLLAALIEKAYFCNPINTGCLMVPAVYAVYPFEGGHYFLNKILC